MRKLLLPALAACALLAVSAPVAPASSHKAHSATVASKLGKLSGALKGLAKNVAKIEKLNKEVDKGLTDSLHGVDLRVDTLVNNLAGVKAVQDAIVAGVPQITAALTTLGNVASSSLVSKPTVVVAQVFSGGVAASNAIRGCFVATPHVPYHGNVATVTINCPVVQVQTDPVGGPENAPAAGGALKVLASCRTAKTNTDLANGKPCANAGIALLQVGGSTGWLTSKANAALGGAPLYPMDANKLFSKDASQAAFPLSLSTGGTDTVDDPAKLLDLTGASNSSTNPLAAAPALGACASGAVPCISTVSLTLRAVDSNAQLPPS